MNYIITHIAYEIVTRRYLIEAENDDDALDKYFEGRSGEQLSEEWDRRDSETHVAEAQQGPDGIWHEKEDVLPSLI